MHTVYLMMMVHTIGTCLRWTYLLYINEMKPIVYIKLNGIEWRIITESMTAEMN